MDDPGPGDPVAPEQVAEALNHVRDVINDLSGRVRDGNANPRLTCGEVVNELSNAVDQYVATTEHFTAGADPTRKRVVATFDVSMAADIAPFLAFEDIDRSTRAIEVAFQHPLPDNAKALTLVSTGEYATTVDLTEPPPAPDQPETAADDLLNRTLQLVGTFIERATHSTTRVLVGGIVGIGPAILAAPFPVPPGLRSVARHIRYLLSRAVNFVSAHVDGWKDQLVDFVNEIPIVERLEEALVGGPLNRLLHTQDVRDELAARGDLAASGISTTLLHRLDSSNNRRVGWAGNAAPIVLGALSTVTLGAGVPALPVAAAVILAWILLVSADQLGAPVVWRLHAFRGIPGAARP